MREVRTFSEIAGIVQVHGLRPGLVLVTGAGVPLVPNHASYGQVPAEDVIARRASPIEVTLTGDGRHYDPAWHEGPEADGMPVYVERWDARGCVFHGWIDRVSRRIVQTG